MCRDSETGQKRVAISRGNDVPPTLIFRGCIDSMTGDVEAGFGMGLRTLKSALCAR
jgi:hypothetical protein